MTMRGYLFLSAAVLAAVACGKDPGFGAGDAGSGGATTTSGHGGMGGDLFNSIGAGGNSSGSDTGGGNAGGGDTCAASETKAKLEPANILFVIDRSGSMNCNPPPTQTSSACELNPVTKDPSKPSKWQVVAKALKDAIAKMPATTSVGIAYFSVDDKCGVATTPAVPLALVNAAQLDAIGKSVDGVTPKGATPIVGGLTLGYKHMYEDVMLSGNKFVVLLTDGAETCAPQLQDKLVNETVPLAASVKIRTFVIGAPGSEPARSLLSRIAFAGGTASDPQCKHDPAPADVGDCHFDMTDPNLDFATELNKALNKISGTALTCEFDVPSSVGKDVDYDKVNVTFTPGMGMDVDFLQDNQACSKADGWQYNANKTKIILCGPACDKVKADPQGKITIKLGCATMISVPK